MFSLHLSLSYDFAVKRRDKNDAHVVAAEREREKKMVYIFLCRRREAMGTWGKVRDAGRLSAQPCSAS